MILVQNLLPQLSGSKFILFVLLLVHFYGCGSTRSGVRTDKNTQIVKAGDKKSSIDSLPGAKTKASDIKMDTIKWVEDKTVKPIKITDKKDFKANTGIELKNTYNVKLLIPLNSDGMNVQQASTSRFVHFYAGLLAALEVLDKEGIKLNFTIIDTEEGKFNISEQVENIVDDQTDLIIGPFEREDVRYIAEKAKEKQIPVISPWQTSTKIAVNNPYYIQIKPNLKEHFLKIVENTTSNFNKQEVAIIGRNNKDYNAWLKYFQESADQFNGTSDGGFYLNYYVLNDSLNSGGSAFYRLIQNPKIKAVILPNYSFNDESFIYSCVRRLAVEKGNKNLVLYGMPILFESDRIDFDFYNSLSMRIVMSDFVDENQYSVKDFRRRYLDLFGEIAMGDAVKAYDIMLYIGRNLWKYGKNFQFYLENEKSTLIQTTFDIKKAKSEDLNESSPEGSFDFFENKHLDIIEFSNSRFRRLNY